MRVFFDTSAFVKRYIEEPGSDRVQAICSRAAQVALSVICLPEMISTLNRLIRAGKITKEQYAGLKGAMVEDLTDIEIVNVVPSVVGCAVRLLEQNSLRALDALHLGCAIEARADVFVSADHRQIEAARRSGVAVEDVRAAIL
jgi:predicted nucleic acid-binding protein